jgi:hypothetical protein
MDVAACNLDLALIREHCRHLIDESFFKTSEHEVTQLRLSSWSRGSSDCS